MLLKNVSGQGIYLYAYIVSTGLPDLSDSANITGSYTLDGTDHSGFSTANPTSIGGGIYWQPLAQAETNANAIAYRWASSTSGVAIAPVFALTTGVSIPVAAPGSAGGVTIAGSNAATTFATLTSTGAFSINGVSNVSQTGDSFARIGATGSGLTSLAPSATALSTAVWTSTLAGYVGNLSGGAVALASTALSTATWTNTLAGYIANLNVGGNVASHADTVSLASSITTVISDITALGSPMQAGAAVSLSLTQTLAAARALDSIADTSLTLNDALQCAVASVTAKIDASSGTSVIYATASTGTTLRTKAVTSITPPATVPDKVV